jgi:hypothetical protein
LRRGKRIPVGAHHDPLAAAAAHPKPAVAIPAYRTHPDRAIIASRPAHHQRLETRQFLGMQAGINQQP